MSQTDPETDPQKDKGTDQDTDNALTYAGAGVDIDAGEALIDLIKPDIKATQRPGSLGTIGGFGGAFDLKAAGFTDPVLISGTDGVGTKLRIAIDTDNLDSLGIDLVAMCVNDVLANGAEPLFFLDYFATGKLENDKAKRIIAGIAKGCTMAGCALIGGETAEMPGLYHGDDFDLAGFVVGAAERSQMLPRYESMEAGDILIGLSSSGAHANGYSLIRKVVERSGLSWDAPSPFAKGQNLGQSLMAPTRIYVQSLLPLIRAGHILGLAHITGGGLTDNTPRMLPSNLCAQFDMQSWARPELFRWLQETGNIAEAEMQRTFNCGIGMVLCVKPNDLMQIIKQLEDSGERAVVIGQLVHA